MVLDRLVNDVTMMTFNIIDFSVITKVSATRGHMVGVVGVVGVVEVINVVVVGKVTRAV